MVSKISLLFSRYKTPIFYSGASILKAFATIIVGFILARYISPSDLGLWTTINLILTYSIFFQAGLINGLNLELPMAYGRGDNKTAMMMAGTVQSFILVFSMIIFAVGILIFFFFPDENEKIRWGVLAITLIVILNYYQSYLISTYRSNTSFYKLSYIQITEALINLSTVVLVIFYSYYGMIIKVVLVMFIYVIMLHISRPIKVRLYWNKIALINVLKVGLPIYGLVLLDSFTISIDKIWILQFATMQDLGLYTFGFYTLTAFTLFSLSVASYVYPKMTFNYGKNKDKNIIWNYVKKITIILLFIQVPLAIIGYFLVPVIIPIYFPNYILSISVMQILLFAGVAKGSVVGVNALWSLKSWKYMILYQSIFSLLMICFTYIGVLTFDKKIDGVAYGILVANVLNFFSGIFFTYLATRTNIN